jgi:hypothetical protein
MENRYAKSAMLVSKSLGRALFAARKKKVRTNSFHLVFLFLTQNMITTAHEATTTSREI